MESVKEWIKNDYFDFGPDFYYDYYDGSGSGSGSGPGYGFGYGSGRGSGSGFGSGYRYGYGYDSGYGSGSGSGSGSVFGYGYDTEFQSAYGIGFFGKKEVFNIDGVQTIIDYIKDSVAKGHILNHDFTLEPCFIVKGNGYFAHGKTLREATTSLRNKIFRNMNSEEAIEKFMEHFEKGKKYLGTEFFEWHHYLTGSCLMGREDFVKNKGIDLSLFYTVDEFIEICKNNYGYQIILKLKEKYGS